MKLRDRFFMGKHQKMERFSAGFLFLVLVLLFTTTVGFRQNSIKNQNLISDKAIFTQKFVTSKTETNGLVAGVYTNTDHTKALVMLRFADINRISTDAKNYMVFVTSADVDGNPRRMNISPKGGIYVFGDTGYVGLYLVNHATFPKQVLDITVRANLELVAKDPTQESSSEAAKGDSSFAKYDQFTVYCNPGGAKATVISSLDGDGMPDAAKLYRDTVANGEVEIAKQEALTQAENLRILLNQVAEHEKRVKDRGVAIPELPKEVVGDVMEKSKDKVPVYTYKVKNDVKGALHFDWQKKTIQEGFMEEAMKNYPSLSVRSGKEFLLASALDAKENPTSLGLNVRDWKLKDGRMIEDLNTAAVTNDDYAAINKACQDYVAVLDSYYRAKLTFQTTTMAAFLRAENVLSTIQDLYSVNTEEKAFTVY